MKKIIALSLSIVIILFCSWIIVSKIEKLDLVPNYTDSYASENKRKIDQRTDIDDCEKKALRSQVDLQQANLREISGEAFQTQIALFVVILLQLILLFFILMMPKK